MAIFRVIKDRENQYVMINKEFLENKNLSLKAKGLLTYLLSLPDNWQIYESELQEHSKDGIDSTRSAIKELIDNGYIERNRSRNEKGELQAYNYNVYEKPIHIGFSKVGKPKVGKSNTTNNNSNNNNITNSLIVEEFEAVWKIYPKKQGKKNALVSFTKARKKGISLKDITSGLKNYIDYIKNEGISQKYIKNGSTWFHQECWDDEYSKSEKLKTSKNKPEWFDKNIKKEELTKEEEIEMQDFMKSFD